MKSNRKTKIEREILLEAANLAYLSAGGSHPNYKTRKANERWLKKTYGSKDRFNFEGDYIITKN